MKDLSKYFTRKIQDSKYAHKKIFNLVTREMQIKATMRRYYKSVQMGRFTKNDLTKDVEKLEMSSYRQESETVRSLWKSLAVS